jgi:hypothetical protein
MKNDAGTGPSDTRTPYEKFSDLAQRVMRSPKAVDEKRARGGRREGSAYNHSYSVATSS